MTATLSYEDKRYLRCVIFPWDGDLTLCRGCNKKLSGRQQRWCSTTCSEKWGRNHWWTWARPARLEMDNHECVRCGWKRPEFTEPKPPEWRAEDGCFYPRSDAEWKAYNAVRREQHAWDLRRRAHMREFPALEVNHVFPLAHQKKRHATTGCHHHLSLLVTLCKPCHRRITNQQFGFKTPSPQLAMKVSA